MKKINQIKNRIKLLQAEKHVAGMNGENTQIYISLIEELEWVIDIKKKKKK